MANDLRQPDGPGGRPVHAGGTTPASEHVRARSAGRPVRKNCWTIAEHVGEADPHGMQHLLRGAMWDADAVRDDVHTIEVEQLGAQDAIFDVVLCVGARHAFGGLEDMLVVVRQHLRLGGQALIGEMIWEGTPSVASLAALGLPADSVPDLAGLIRAFHRHGLEQSFGHVRTLTEWDDCEFSWTGSLVDWAVRSVRTVEDRAQALTAAREHRLRAANRSLCRGLAAGSSVGMTTTPLVKGTS